LTVREAAERMEVSKSLVYRLVDEGRLKAVRIGQRGRRGKIVIMEPDVVAFLKTCEAKAS